MRAALGGGVVIRAVRRERHALGRRARPARPAPAPRRAAARRAAPGPGRQLQQSSAASCWRTRAPECAYSSATYGCWPSQPEGAQRGAQRRTPACQQLRSRPNAAHTRRCATRPAERSTRSLACLPPSLHEHSRWKGEHPARRARGRRGASHAGSANTLSCTLLDSYEPDSYGQMRQQPIPVASSSAAQFTFEAPGRHPARARSEGRRARSAAEATWRHRAPPTGPATMPPRMQLGTGALLSVRHSSLEACIVACLQAAPRWRQQLLCPFAPSTPASCYAFLGMVAALSSVPAGAPHEKACSMVCT